MDNRGDPCKSQGWEVTQGGTSFYQKNLSNNSPQSVGTPSVRGYPSCTPSSTDTPPSSLANEVRALLELLPSPEEVRDYCKDAVSKATPAMRSFNVFFFLHLVIWVCRDRLTISVSRLDIIF